MTEINKSECPCCGALRDYPTEEGDWEFFDYNNWHPVRVSRNSDGLIIIPKGETNPIWWPNNVRWRKI